MGNLDGGSVDAADFEGRDGAIALARPLAAQNERGGGRREEGNRSADPEGPLEAARKCSVRRVAAGEQRLHMGGGDGGGDRDPDCAAELLRGVEQAGGEPGLSLGDTGEAADRDRDEAERAARAAEMGAFAVADATFVR
jgi:hypothetical protein